METIVMIVIIVLAAGVLLLPLGREKQTGRFESTTQTVHPPAAYPPEAPCFLTFRSRGGVTHIRADRIESFSYDNACRALVINDGRESPVVVPDSRCRYYARLCERFGTVPMADNLKGGKRP